MNDLQTITAAIISVLAANLGTFDLSGTDQVKEGAFQVPPGSQSFAAVYPPVQISSVPQCRDTWYLETYQVPIHLWGTYTTDTTGSRAARGRLMAGEAKRALDNSRATVGSALWKCVYFRSAQVTPDPTIATAPSSWVHSTLLVELSFRRATGTGV